MGLAFSDVELSAVDLAALELYADGPPHELFARMRDEAPVSWTPSRTGGFWSITKAQDIERISKDPETFSSYAHGTMLEDDVPWPLEVKRMIMLNMDPPDHTKYRMIVQRAFTPYTVNRQEAQIRACVTRILDAVISAGQCDFVSDVATELPLQTIAAMLGVPYAERMPLFHWTKRIEAAMHVPGSTEGMQAFGEIGQYLASLVAQRRETPGDDLVTAIVNAEVDGEHLSDGEITAFFGLLMFAGNDTTRNTASGGLLALLEHPAQWQALVGDPRLIPGAVEEMLRWVSAVVYFRRTAMRDTEMRGVTIKAGDSVVMWYPSGSRDDDLVSDPDRFDVTRESVRHQAFGGGGRHFCLGSQLARLQLRVLFEELVRRAPDVVLNGDVVRGGSNFVNAFDALPIRFSARSAPAAAAA